MRRNNPDYIQARKVMAKYSTLNIKFSTPPDVKEHWPNDDGSFYIIYSPKKIQLRPRESIMLDLELKITYLKAQNKQ